MEREQFEKLTKAEQTRYNRAWQQVSDAIEDAAAPGAKVFEIHHEIEAARRIFKRYCASGIAADDCRAQTLKEIGK